MQNKIYYCDMDQKGFDNNIHMYNENLAIEICEDDMYNIEDLYSEKCDIALEPLEEYGRGWYTYTETDPETDEEQRRYVYVDRIEKPDPDYPNEWIINIDRWKEYGHGFSAAELAALTGKTKQAIYHHAQKLGRLPTPDELKAARPGPRRKYF